MAATTPHQTFVDTMSELPLERRQRLKSLLENNFDAKSGSYLGNNSDETIAARAELDVQIVQLYRTSIFGSAADQTSPATEHLARRLVDLEEELRRLKIEHSGDDLNRLLERCARNLVEDALHAEEFQSLLRSLQKQIESRLSEVAKQRQENLENRTRGFKEELQQLKQQIG